MRIPPASELDLVLVPRWAPLGNKAERESNPLSRLFFGIIGVDALRVGVERGEKVP